LRELGGSPCFYCDAAIRDEPVPHDAAVTRRVAAWAYRQADQAGATVWKHGREGMVGLDPRWRDLLGG
jgi:hypothetical protein